MQTRIQGTVMPVLEVQLDRDESVFAESGELSWMTASIQMSTHTQFGGGGPAPQAGEPPPTAQANDGQVRVGLVLPLTAQIGA